MVNPIDIHALTLEELSGVIALYPWYGGARMELCRRMSELGALSDSQIAETAIHLGRREILARMLRKNTAVDCSDKDARLLAEAFMPHAAPAERPYRVYVVGGDYFSQAEYADARHDGDSLFSRFAVSGPEGDASAPAAGEEEQAGDFCTETLARIYLEQGYPAEARAIYSKLILRYPEKSVYFAALIEEIDKKNN